MAWKLRKDMIQEGSSTLAPSAQEEAILSDTSVSEQPLPSPAEEPHPFAPADFDFVPSDPPAAPSTDLPDFDLPGFDTDFDEYAPSAAGLDQVTEPEQTHPEPIILAPPPSDGPFAPFQSADPETDELQPLAPLSREEVAPSLVDIGSTAHVPQVAPYIVDLPPASSPSPPESGTLTIRIGNLSAVFTLIKDVTLIGRPDSILQHYPDVEIELDDAVSRSHAEIRHQENRYVIVDLQSTNGTLLNGERLDPDREYLLAHGDHIHLGDRTEIVFE